MKEYDENALVNMKREKLLQQEENLQADERQRKEQQMEEEERYTLQVMKLMRSPNIKIM